MKKIIHLTLFLAIVSAIAGAALAFANQMTAPIIAANEEASLLELYPGSTVDDFTEVSYEGDSSTIQKIYRYKEEAYVFSMSVSGYSEGTTFLVSITNDGTVDAYKGMTNGDTKGLGSRVLDDETFINGLVGHDAAGQLDTISGATRSSQPVVDGINEAAAVVEQLEAQEV